MAFAKALVGLVEEMKATSKGQPQLPEVVPSALSTMTELEWARPTSPDWLFAGFDELFRYLRGSKKLRIPSEWREVIPDSLRQESL